MTATSATGEIAQAQVAVTAIARTLSLTAPRAGDYDGPAVLTGTLRPAKAGARVHIYRGRTHVTTTVAHATGRFRAVVRLRSPGPYRAVYGDASSRERRVLVRPRLTVTIPANAVVGARSAVTARVTPAAASPVTVRVLAGRRLVAKGRGAVRLPTGAVAELRVEVISAARSGFAAVRRAGRTSVVQPVLVRGSTGPSVLALERRLRELRYALRGVDTVFGLDTFEALTAFQKVYGLPRTGRVETSLWRRLAAAAVPLPRYGRGDHIEVDKGRNVLYEIVGGRVNRIVHVSTGLTGNTPLGTFHVYRKVGGWDWVLWYPMYFLRGFAIHGYPSVPAYPASHGCVRVPMWIAPSLFSRHEYGARIVVYA